jgi:hypothetical protein
VRAVHESDTAESLMPSRLVAGPWTLNPADDVRIGFVKSNPAASSLTTLKFPIRPMAGRCALNAEIVVQVHGREPELSSIGRMADCLSAGTGSTPVSSAINLREIRPAARTLASRSSYEVSTSPPRLQIVTANDYRAHCAEFRSEEQIWMPMQVVRKKP